MCCVQVRSKTGALSIFRRVTVCTETVEATDGGGEEDRMEMEDKEPETRRIQDLPSLLDQVSSILHLLSSSPPCPGRGRTVRVSS